MSKKDKDKDKEKPDEIPNPFVESGGEIPSPTNNPDTNAIDDIVRQHTQDVNQQTPSVDSKPTDNVIQLPRKRGRPPGSKNRSKAVASGHTPQSVIKASLFPRPAIKAVNALPYSLIANYYGSHWNLSDEEAESLVDVSIALADKYLPDTIKQNPEVYAFCLMHGMIVFAKMELHYRLLKEKKPKETKPLAAEEKPTNAEGDNSIPRENRLRQEFSGLGVHKTTTEIDSI